MAELDAGCIDRVVADYKHTLDQILTQIDRLRGCGEVPGVPPCSERGQSDTLLRIVTVYNSTIGDNVDPSWNSPLAIAPTVRANNLMVHAQCEVIRIHGGRCADIYRVMNGPTEADPPPPTSTARATPSSTSLATKPPQQHSSSSDSHRSVSRLL